MNADSWIRVMDVIFNWIVGIWLLLLLIVFFDVFKR